MSYTYSNNTTKYIDIESNTTEKLDSFLIDIQNIDFTIKLNQNPFPIQIIMMTLL